LDPSNVGTCLLRCSCVSGWPTGTLGRSGNRLCRTCGFSDLRSADHVLIADCARQMTTEHRSTGTPSSASAHHSRRNSPAQTQSRWR
jgi:hypothetical protein